MTYSSIKSTYAKELLDKLYMSGYKTAPTLLSEGLTTQSERGMPTVDQTQYYQVVGKLLYLTNTRPDLSHSVGVVAYFMYAL